MIRCGEVWEGGVRRWGRCEGMWGGVSRCGEM